MHDLDYSVPGPGDWVLLMLEKRNLKSREEEVVKSLRLTELERGRPGACGVTMLLLSWLCLSCTEPRTRHSAGCSL